MKIYVAGPLTDGGTTTRAEATQNMLRAYRIGWALFQRGHAPYVPHWNLGLQHDLEDHGLFGGDWDTWMRFDRPWLEACDALFYMGPSKGTDEERRIAEERGMPVFTCLEEVPRGEMS